jgi:HEAT repeat protein
MAADRRVVLAAAKALSRHGDASGRRELARMMWHPDAAVRRQAVSAAAESGDAWFVGPLVRVAEDETDPATLRAALDGLDRLVPPENRPDGLANAATIRAKIAAWIAWQRTHGGALFGRRATSDKDPADDRDP